MSLLDAVKWIRLPSIADQRGVLTSVESRIDIPFDIKRIFLMHHITTDRGGHAHRDTDQVIIAAAGSFKVDLSNGTNHRTYKMNDPNRGLYTPRMVFIRLYEFSPKAVCLVIANTHYDMSRSVRTWEDYLRLVQS